MKLNRNDITGHRTCAIKRFSVVFIAVGLFVDGLHSNRLGAGELRADHLVPVVEYLGSAQLYRKLWNEKLLITPGEIARYVHLPAFTDLEIAVSVYQQNGKHGSLPGGYWVTVTKPSAPLSNCVPSVNVKNPVDPRTVRIRRTDTPLPESTALAVGKLWSTMLQDMRPESNAIAVDSSTEIFSAAASNGKVLEAQLPVDAKDHTLALAKVANLLIDYPSASASARPKLAREIEKGALTLLDRLSKH